MENRRSLAPFIAAIRPAGPDHQVVEVHGSSGAWRRKPCADCPWRRDAVGIFPAEAFRHSADTAQDMSVRKFACHQSGTRNPAVCAGFLLRGAEHNLAVRLALSHGEIDPAQISDDGHALFEDYVEMAIANGVAPEDPALAACRRTGR